ncbi:MAG: leucine-rich repeat domain-containing protein [Clostridia bacterium]|nr:leucine-rich repeat domain-containing protein [Clostridia bacterium]
MKIDENGVLFEIEPSDVVDGTLVIPDGVKKIDWGDCKIGKNLVLHSKRTLYDEYENKSISVYTASTSVKNVQLPNTLMELCDNCFWGFKDLEKIILPDSVKKIGKGCFRDCESAKQIRLSRRLEEIPAETFQGCNLHTLIIPDSVHTIAKNAFAENDYYTRRVDSKIDNIRFPKVMDKLDIFMLNNVGSSQGMKCITLPKEVKELSFINKNPYDEIVMPNQFGFNENLEESVERVVKEDPSKFIFRNKKGSKAFEKNISNLRNEEEPIGRKEIGMSDVLENGLQSSKIVIKDVDVIGEFTFAECQNLEEVIIEEGVKSIERGAFAFCPNLKRVQLPKSLEYIGSCAFALCESLERNSDKIRFR